MYRLSGKFTSRGEREKRPMLSQLSLTRSPVYLCNCTLTNYIVPNMLLAPEDIKQNVWYATFCAFRRERIVCDLDFDYLATCKNGQ